VIARFDARRTAARETGTTIILKPTNLRVGISSRLPIPKTRPSRLRIPQARNPSACGVRARKSPPARRSIAALDVSRARRSTVAARR